MSEWVLSERAADDLIDIDVYTHQEFGNLQAEAYTGEIEVQFSALAANPGLGRVMVDLPGGYLQLVYRSHVIVYRADEQGIFIVRVLQHGRRDIPNRLQDDC